MDHRQFDDLTRSLTALTSTSPRRAFTRLLATSSLAAALGSGIHLAEAAKKKRHAKKNGDKVDDEGKKNKKKSKNNKKKNKKKPATSAPVASSPEPPPTSPPVGGSCANGTTACGGACVNTNNDRNHCGACGAACQSGETCASGRCARGGCPDGQKDCRGTCIPVANCCTDSDCEAGTCQSGTCHWEPVRAETEREEVASERYMQTKATLNANGLLTVESTTWNEVFAGFALRGRVLVVVEDAQGRAIWVSQVFDCTTRCPFIEFCDKSGKNVFQEQFPDHPQLGSIVGKYAAKLAIYQSNGTSDITFRDRWVAAIKDATDIARPLIELAKLFL